MVRLFEWVLMKGMGLRDYPHWLDIYFAHYKRVLYITQTDDAALVEKARQAAIKSKQNYARYGDYTVFFRNLSRRRQPSIAAS